jgi:hypothetical protein
MALDKGQWGQVFWITDEDKNWDEKKSKYFFLNPDGQFHNYIFGLSEIEGKVIQLRLDPTDVPTMIKIDYIKLLNLPAWEFDRTSEGWSAWNQLSAFEVSDGTLKTKSLGNDPYMGSPVLDNIRPTWMDIRMALDKGQWGQVFWITDEDKNWDEKKSKYFFLNPDGQFHNYHFNFGVLDNPRWGIKGKVIQLRLDPADVPAEIKIDYIRLE